MRIINKQTVAAIFVALVCIGTSSAQASAAQGGLTITPATLTLRLAKGNTAQTGTFTITNRYAAPLTLRFMFEPSIGAPTPEDPSTYMRVEQNYRTLAPGESLRQKIVVQDSTKLAPGSHTADLAISQTAQTNDQVGVLPSIRMPLIVIKEDGAVRALTLSTFGSSGLAVMMPHTRTATIHNSGNTISIPHGFITITAPDGTVIRKGTLNTASLAISPGKNVTLPTSLSETGSALWPGIYRTTLSYGLGGGQTATTASNWFIYVAWWHLLALAILAVSALYAVKYQRRKQTLPAKRSAPRHVPPPKKMLLIGRDL